VHDIHRHGTTFAMQYRALLCCCTAMFRCSHLTQSASAVWYSTSTGTEAFVLKTKHEKTLFQDVFVGIESTESVLYLLAQLGLYGGASMDQVLTKLYVYLRTCPLFLSPPGAHRLPPACRSLYYSCSALFYSFLSSTQHQ